MSWRPTNEWTTPEDLAWLVEQLRDDERLDEPIALDDPAPRYDVAEIVSDEATDAYTWEIIVDSPAGSGFVSLYRWRGRYFIRTDLMDGHLGPMRDPVPLVQSWFPLNDGVGGTILEISGDEWQRWLSVSLADHRGGEVPVKLDERTAVVSRSAEGDAHWEFARDGRICEWDDTRWVAVAGRWVRA